MHVPVYRFDDKQMMTCIIYCGGEVLIQDDYSLKFLLRSYGLRSRPYSRGTSKEICFIITLDHFM